MRWKCEALRGMVETTYKLACIRSLYYYPECTAGTQRIFYVPTATTSGGLRSKLPDEQKPACQSLLRKLPDEYVH